MFDQASGILCNQGNALAYYTSLHLSDQNKHNTRWMRTKGPDHGTPRRYMEGNSPEARVLLDKNRYKNLWRRN